MTADVYQALTGSMGIQLERISFQAQTGIEITVSNPVMYGCNLTFLLSPFKSYLMAGMTMLYHLVHLSKMYHRSGSITTFATNSFFHRHKIDMGKGRRPGLGNPAPKRPNDRPGFGTYILDSRQQSTASVVGSICSHL